jgi:DUF971 family protein
LSPVWEAAAHSPQAAGLDAGLYGWSFISDLENGKKEICIRNLELLASAFGLSVAQLLTRL